MTSGTTTDNASHITAMMLFCTFLVLKLTEVIDWSWWYITMPLWGGAVLVALVAAVAGIVVGLRELKS